MKHLKQLCCTARNEKNLRVCCVLQNDNAFVSLVVGSATTLRTPKTTCFVFGRRSYSILKVEPAQFLHWNASECFSQMKETVTAPLSAGMTTTTLPQEQVSVSRTFRPSLFTRSETTGPNLQDVIFWHRPHCATKVPCSCMSRKLAYFS